MIPTIIIDILASITNAYCDKNVVRVNKWWPWHIAKWIHFFLPLALLNYLFVPWYMIIPTAIICRVVWRTVYYGHLEI